MMQYVAQIIKKPFGINVFGSAIIRVSPDVAILHFAVSRIDKLPKEAFSKTRDTVKKVNEYLHNSDINDVSSSRVSLTQHYEFTGPKREYVGYMANVRFQVLLDDLDKVEEILIGVVNLGVNKVYSTSFHTRKLKEYRAEARKRAVSAANEKANIYCESSNVVLGDIIHIEDVSPDILSGRYEGHQFREFTPDDSGEIKTFDPGAITVGGAVVISFKIKYES